MTRPRAVSAGMLRYLAPLGLLLAACTRDAVTREAKTEVRAAVEVSAPTPRPMRAGRHTLMTSAGELAFTLHRSEAVDGPLFIYCGGAGFTVPAFGEAIIDKLAPFGDVLVWDYPGRGRSGGVPGLVQARAFTESLQTRLPRLREPDQSVVYWGHSMGGFICADMVADDPGAAGLVLESTAMSADAVAARLGDTALALLLRTQLPPEAARFSIPERLAGSDASVLVIGGARDRVLPVSLQRDLADAIPGARYIEYERANHFDAGLQPGFADDITSYLEGLP